MLAEAAVGKRTLILMYNSQLSRETTARVKALGVDEYVTVMTYHSLGFLCYTSECVTDEGLKRAVEENLPLNRDMVPRVDALILDEQQDMNPISKRFLDKLMCEESDRMKDDPKTIWNDVSRMS